MTYQDASISEQEEYTPEFLKELDRRRAAYEKDGELISMSEMDARIKKILDKYEYE